MDLREVLAEVLSRAAAEGPDLTVEDDFEHLADAVLARLREHDFLDEFEWRVNRRFFGLKTTPHPWEVVTTARFVLSDMLGGGS